MRVLHEEVWTSYAGTTNLLPEFSFSRTVPKDLFSIDRWLKLGLSLTPFFG